MITHSDEAEQKWNFILKNTLKKYNNYVMV